METEVAAEYFGTDIIFLRYLCVELSTVLTECCVSTMLCLATNHLANHWNPKVDIFDT